MANKLLSDRDEIWDSLPVKVIEAEVDFEKPLAVANLAHPSQGGKRKCIQPHMVFSPEDDWTETLREQMKLALQSAKLHGSDPFKAEDYEEDPCFGKGRCFGLAVILRTPTRVHCVPMVFPVRVLLEDILLLAPASLVNTEKSESDENWDGDQPVHVIDINLPEASLPYLVFPEDPLDPPGLVKIDPNPKALYFLSTTGWDNVVLHKLTRTRATLPMTGTPQVDGLWNSLKDQMFECCVQRRRLDPKDVGLLTHGLVVIIRHPEGVNYSVSLLPVARTMADILLMAPATLVLESIPQVSH